MKLKARSLRQTGRVFIQHRPQGTVHRLHYCRALSSHEHAPTLSHGVVEERGKWKWFGIPWRLGIVCLAVLQLFRTVRRERKKEAESESEPVTWQLSMFRLLPARPLSRAWGELASYELPEWLRKPVLGLYVWAFGCKMEEALLEEVGAYKSLMELFTRRLKYGTRRLSMQHELLSPSDGKVLHFGKVKPDGKLEQVKGVTYHLDYFLGSELLDTVKPTSVLKERVDSVSSNNGGKEAEEANRGGDEPNSHVKKHLYHVILYLAPGDYHHFHSPANWNISARRHFPGELLTVAPWAAKTMPGLFALNERVVLAGRWKHGFFSFTAVGAYNVGSINIAVDKNLKTNVKGRYKMGEFSHRQLDNDGGIEMKRGDRIGHFNLGSSIVLVFEAPDHFEFQVKPGQTIKYGQPLGTFSSQQQSNTPMNE